VDYAWVAARIAQLAADYHIERIRFDRWAIKDLKHELGRIGCRVPLEEHGQGYRDMAPALTRLEGLALNGRLRHGNHPILTWCAANAVATMDPAGNRKLDKVKATGRIDGLVALAMAVSGPKDNTPAFPYHDRGIRTLNLGASL
jgi:phage terminase large subunit-like protein